MVLYTFYSPASSVTPLQSPAGPVLVLALLVLVIALRMAGFIRVAVATLAALGFLSALFSKGVCQPESS